MDSSAHELQRLQDEVAALQAERKLLTQSLEYHERDRQLLAFEIHDGIIQDMTAALMFLESAGGQAALADEKARESYDHGLRLLRGSVEEARRLIGGLIPVQLDERGLVASLENLVLTFQSERGIEIDFAAEVQLRNLAAAVELIVLRIAQEALNNVGKHSQSPRAEVSLVQAGDELVLTVQDFGVGFDPAAVQPGRYGLTGIRERARLLGGQATIDSQPGQGTCVTARIPCRETPPPVP